MEPGQRHVGRLQRAARCGEPLGREEARVRGRMCSPQHRAGGHCCHSQDDGQGTSPAQGGNHDGPDCGRGHRGRHRAGGQSGRGEGSHERCAEHADLDRPAPLHTTTTGPELRTGIAPLPPASSAARPRDGARRWAPVWVVSTTEPRATEGTRPERAEDGCSSAKISWAWARPCWLGSRGEGPPGKSEENHRTAAVQCLLQYPQHD